MELRVNFGGNSYVPDVAVYRWDRIPVDPDGTVADDLFEPPDIAVEITSSELSATAQIRRCLWYIRHGVQIALLIDSDDRSVLRFRPGQQVDALLGDEMITLTGVLDDFALTVQELFDSLRIR